jgi:L-aspartate oxidase
VHGANRLASNSLLEGLVFAARIATDLAGGLPTPAQPGDSVVGRGPTGLSDPSVRADLVRAMTDGAGVLRSADSLHATIRTLTAPSDNPITAGPDAWEMTNLRTVATALVTAAAMRQETRGSHWRADFPASDDAAWRGHILTRLDADGELSVTYEPSDIDDFSGEMDTSDGSCLSDAGTVSAGRASDAA